MSAASTRIRITGNLQTASGGSLSFNPPTIYSSNPVGGSTPVALSTTPQEITFEAGTQVFSIGMPEGNQVAVTLRWKSGDTGNVIHKTIGVPLCGLDPSNLSFYLVAASAVTVQIWSA